MTYFYWVESWNCQPYSILWIPQTIENLIKFNVKQTKTTEAPKRRINEIPNWKFVVIFVLQTKLVFPHPHTGYNKSMRSHDIHIFHRIRKNKCKKPINLLHWMLESKTFQPNISQRTNSSLDGFSLIGLSMPSPSCKSPFPIKHEIKCKITY